MFRSDFGSTFFLSGPDQTPGSDSAAYLQVYHSPEILAVLLTDEYVRHPDDVCKGRVERGVVPVGVPALQVLLLIHCVTMNVVMEEGYL